MISPAANAALKILFLREADDSVCVNVLSIDKMGGDSKLASRQKKKNPTKKKKKKDRLE